MKFDGSQIDRIERDIAPPMKECITIPAGDPFEGIAVYVGSSPFFHGPSQAGTLTAIARQIAASSELLEALRALVAETERTDNPGDMGVGTDSDEMIAARAVIAKAEGRQ